MLVAVLIGSIEVMGLVGDQFGLEGDLWRLVRALNDNFNALGFAIIAVFIVAWAVSVTVYRPNRLDEISADILDNQRSGIAGLVTGRDPASN